MKRERWNTGWKVWKDLDPFELVFRVPDDAKEVDLPWDAMFHEKQSAQSVNGGACGHLDGGEYKYSRTLFAEEAWRGKPVFLQFEGVYRNASVFVNGSKVGGCAYGYTDFCVEIGDYLRFGEENRVLVCVKCGTRNSRWYTGAGILRDVWLLTGEETFVPPYGLRMTTLSLSPEGALVELEARIENRRLASGTWRADAVLTDEDGKEAAAGSWLLRMKGRESITLRRRIFVENARLWSAEHPHLYTAELTLTGEGGETDRASAVFGIRTLSADSRHGLLVNGESVKLRGACIHHDEGVLGGCAYADYEYWRIKKLKAAGFNAVRSAHNPASQAVLSACDELGMYVMDELVDVWNKSKVSYDYAIDFERDWKKDIEHMTAADYNHPSVVLYSTGNEIFEICTDKGIETSRMLADHFHACDPTRLTTNGINGAFAAGDGLKKIVDDITNGTADTGKGDVNVFMAAMETSMPAIVAHPILTEILEKLEPTMDILGYNYMTSRYLMDAEKYPDRVMVGSETYPKQIAENWDAITRCPAVIGDFTWTGWDYMGEVPPVFPALVNRAGDVSLTGQRRPVSYYREIVFGLQKGPVIAVQHPERFGIPRNFGPWCYTDCTFSYRYPGCEGKPVMIQVYAGGDEVELFQDGRSLGRKPCGKQTGFEAMYETVYAPGTLEAVAYEGGKEIGRSVLKTAGPNACVAADAESMEELILVEVSVCDAQGNFCADSEALLTAEVSGPAVLLAFGSTGASHENGFEKPAARASEGTAVLVLKRTGEGEVLVRIGGDGLAPAELTV